MAKNPKFILGISVLDRKKDKSTDLTSKILSGTITPKDFKQVRGIKPTLIAKEIESTDLLAIRFRFIINNTQHHEKNVVVYLTEDKTYPLKEITWGGYDRELILWNIEISTFLLKKKVFKNVAPERKGAFLKSLPYRVLETISWEVEARAGEVVRPDGDLIIPDNNPSDSEVIFSPDDI